MTCYKNNKFNNDGGSLQGWPVHDDKSDNNNKDKIDLLLRTWDW